MSTPRASDGTILHMLNHHEKPHHTFMYLWIVGAVVVLIVGMVGYALKHPRTVLAPVPIEQVVVPPVIETSTTLTLALGERGQVGEFSLVLDKILEDSRCPQEVECIQAGTVRVLGTAFGTSTLELTLGETSTTDSMKVTLVRVEPDRMNTTRPDVKDYRFVLLVEKR